MWVRLKMRIVGKADSLAKYYFVRAMFGHAIGRDIVSESNAGDEHVPIVHINEVEIVIVGDASKTLLQKAMKSLKSAVGLG